MDDIIQLSVEKVYRSQDVIEKELAGYRIIADLLEIFITALVHHKDNRASNYDRLILQSVPPLGRFKQATLYQLLMGASCFVASLSDTEAVHLHNKMTGRQV